MQFLILGDEKEEVRSAAILAPFKLYSAFGCNDVFLACGFYGEIAVVENYLENFLTDIQYANGMQIKKHLSVSTF
jgi:hypothetical protein